MSDDRKAAARTAYDAHMKEVRENVAKAEARMVELPPTPTQEEADLAVLGLIGPEGFASSKAPEPSEQRSVPRQTAAPAARPEPPRTRD